MENRTRVAGGTTAAAWAAVLASAVGVLPGLCARMAGEGGWLAPLVALPAVLLLGRLLGALSREGLAATFVRLLGAAAGKVLTIIYIMWALLLGCARLRLAGRRLLFTAQREAGLWFFLPVLAVMAAWLAWGKPGAFVRAAAVFSRILTLALGAVLVLTVFQVRRENLWPIWAGDILPVLRSAVPTLGVLCVGVYAAFLWEGAPEQGWKRKTVGGCAVLAVLQLSVLGTVGAELSAALEAPFITLSKHVGVEGAFQRVESLVSALWVLGDLTLLGLLLWACRCMVQTVCPDRDGRTVALAGAGLILAGAGLLFRDAALAQRFEYSVAPMGNLVLGAAVPTVLFLLEKAAGTGRGKGHILCRLRRKKADIEDGNKGQKNF